MQLIRVVLVDDQDMVRTALEVFFETSDDLKLVGTARNTEEAILVCESERPDVVLMDIMLSDKPDGIRAARAIRQENPAIRIIAISSFCTVELADEVFEAGISSYLYKNMSIDELAEAIRAVYEGKSVVSSFVADSYSQAGKQLPH